MSRRPGTYKYKDEIPCRLCGKAFQAIAWKHLQRKHQFDGPTAVEDYKRRFGLSRVRTLALERKRLRSYIAFLEAHGNHWTKERVLQQLRRRRDAGKPLNHAAVAQASGSLRDAACKFFGSWDKTLAAAGLDPRKIERRTRWTKPRMIRELRECAENGAWRPRASTRKRCVALRAAAKNLFASWPAALHAADLKPRYASRTRWTKDEVVRRIKRRARLGLDLSHTEVVRFEPALSAAARRILRRPWSVVIQDLGYRGRQIVWTDDVLRREIARAHRLEPAGLPGVSRNAVYQAARKRFGTWGRALQAVGLKPTHPLPLRWTKERVLARIRERARCGESLSWRVVLKSEKGLYRAARRFFGKPWTSLDERTGT
jgi:hypothetical protein